MSQSSRINFRQRKCINLCQYNNEVGKCMNQNDDTKGDTLKYNQPQLRMELSGSHNLDTGQPNVQKFWIQMRNVNLSE